MKIDGPNAARLTAYKNQLQQQTEPKKATNRKDQLNISSEAKQLQETKKTATKRAAYVENIKNAVESGQYKVNYEKTAQKMIDFWSKHS